MDSPDDYPHRRHLARLPRVWTRDPVYLVTLCTARRAPILTTGGMPAALVASLTEAAHACGWRVGRYVVMPDHCHVLCAPAAHLGDLSALVAHAKSVSTRRAWGDGLQGALWQRGFFDHLIRSEEQLTGKWHYVRQNPVRAGLCGDPDEWPFQGEIDVL